MSSVTQRQLQSFRASARPAKEVGEDFSIYYVAGKVARQVGDRTLYYPSADGQKLTFRNLLDPVPSDAAWTRVAEACGFHSTGRFMAPPFTALLAEPLTRMPPMIALLAWRLASTLFLVMAVYLSLVLFEGTRHSLELFVAAVAAGFSFFPFVETLFQGQVDAFVLLLWVLGVYFVQTIIGRRSPPPFVSRWRR